MCLKYLDGFLDLVSDHFLIALLFLSLPPINLLDTMEVTISRNHHAFLSGKLHLDLWVSAEQSVPHLMHVASSLPSHIPFQTLRGGPCRVLTPASSLYFPLSYKLVRAGTRLPCGFIASTVPGVIKVTLQESPQVVVHGPSDLAPFRGRALK
jgi:hypothetical protein